MTGDTTSIVDSWLLGRLQWPALLWLVRTDTAAVVKGEAASSSEFPIAYVSELLGLKGSKKNSNRSCVSPNKSQQSRSLQLPQQPAVYYACCVSCYWRSCQASVKPWNQINGTIATHRLQPLFRVHGRSLKAAFVLTWSPNKAGLHKMTHKACFQKLGPNSEVTSSDFVIIWPDR